MQGCEAIWGLSFFGCFTATWPLAAARRNRSSLRISIIQIELAAQLCNNAFHSSPTRGSVRYRGIGAIELVLVDADSAFEG